MLYRHAAGLKYENQTFQGANEEHRLNVQSCGFAEFKAAFSKYLYRASTFRRTIQRAYELIIRTISKPAFEIR